MFLAARFGLLLYWRGFFLKFFVWRYSCQCSGVYWLIFRAGVADGRFHSHSLVWSELCSSARGRGGGVGRAIGRNHH